MKANKLMIGDLVHCITDNTIHRILRLNLEDDYLKKGELYKNEENKLNYLFDVEPIPLTEDILEANGFEFGLTSEQEDFCAMHASCGVSAEKSWVKEDGDALYSISWLDGFVTVTNLKDSIYEGKCEYVHELQHALRLCGLNKLADNLIM